MFSPGFAVQSRFPVSGERDFLRFQRSERKRTVKGGKNGAQNGFTVRTALVICVLFGYNTVEVCRIWHNYPVYFTILYIYIHILLTKRRRIRVKIIYTEILCFWRKRTGKSRKNVLKTHLSASRRRNYPNLYY